MSATESAAGRVTVVPRETATEDHPSSAEPLGLSRLTLRRLRAALTVAAILPAVLLGLTIGGRTLGEAIFGSLVLYALPILASASRPDEDDRAAADPTRLLVARSVSAISLMITLMMLAVPDPLGPSAGMVILTLLFPTALLQSYRPARTALLYGAGVLTMALILLAPELVILPLIQLPPILGLFALLPVVERTEREGGLGRGLIARFAAALPCGLALLLLIALVDRCVPALGPVTRSATRPPPSLVENPWTAAGLALALFTMGLWLIVALRRLRGRKAAILIDEPEADPLADLSDLDALDDSPRSRILRRFLTFLAGLPVERRPALTARETSKRAASREREPTSEELEEEAKGFETLTPGLAEALMIFEAARYGLREPELDDLARLERAILSATAELEPSAAR